MGCINDDKNFIGQSGYMPSKSEQRREAARPKLNPKFLQYKKIDFDNGGKYESYEEYVKRTKPWED